MDTNLLPQVEEKIITLRNQQVILSNHVAELYGVETREINQAVKNNPRKFPEGYIFQLDNQEVNSLRSKILTLKNGGRGQHSKYTPKAFTEVVSRDLHAPSTSSVPLRPSVRWRSGGRCGAFRAHAAGGTRAACPC